MRLGCVCALGVVPVLYVLLLVTDYLEKGGGSRPEPASASKPKRKPAAPVPQYSVVSAEDISYANVPRKSYRVRVPREMTEAELTAISQEIVRQARGCEWVKAIVIFYYLPDSDTAGGFTAGKATWAPGGDWSKAATRLSPRLVVKAGGAMGTISEENVVDLPVARKKLIFTHMVRNQDGGMDVDQSYAAAARQFGVTVEQAQKIGIEGIVRGWPMPSVRETELLPQSRPSLAPIATTQHADGSGGNPPGRQPARSRGQTAPPPHLAAIRSTAEAAAPPPVEVGQSREQVVAALGEPRNLVSFGDTETLIYDNARARGKVKLRAGKVVSFTVTTGRGTETGARATGDPAGRSGDDATP